MRHPPFHAPADPATAKAEPGRSDFALSESGARRGSLSFGEAGLLSAAAVVAFHLAYSFRALNWLIVLYLFCLLKLAGLGTARRAFYFGLAVGMAAYGPQLSFFWTIFKFPAIALWLVLSFWLGLFVALSRLCLKQFGWTWTIALAPFLWTGLEYFRSELYYLRFSWLNVGYVFSENPWLSATTHLGMYGIGFVLMVAAGTLVWTLRTRHASSTNCASFGQLLHEPRPLTPSLSPGGGEGGRRPGEGWTFRVLQGFKDLRFERLPRCLAWLIGALVITAVVLVSGLPRGSNSAPDNTPSGISVAAVQMEAPMDAQIPPALDQLIARHPEAQLVVLSEYTFDGPVPESVKNWCRINRRYLIAGGKDFVSDTTYYNTAFVVGPAGDIIHRQVKSVPIQFYKDGLPAREQKLWDSPWGRIGICICYDLSYTRVTDRLVRQGAQALIVPTMDEMHWGEHQHRLHARVAPTRAAEYGVPIFRVASSGMSQIVDRAGRVNAEAPFPGQQAMIAGRLALGPAGSLPLDRFLAPLSVGISGLLAGGFGFTSLKERRGRKRKPGNELRGNFAVPRCFGWNDSAGKLQIPSSKLQRNSKPQTSTRRPGCHRAGFGLGFEIWSFSGAWCLGLGTSARAVFQRKQRGTIFAPPWRC